MSLFSGLNTASNPPPPPPPAEPSSEVLAVGDDASSGATGGGIFNGLNSGGSAFGFIGGDQAAPGASDGLGSAFGFIGASASDDSAGASATALQSGGAPLFDFMNLGSEEPAGAPASSGTSATSAFGFIGMGSTSEPAPAASTGTDSMSMFGFITESSSAAPPPPTDVGSQSNLLASLSMPSEAPAPAPLTSLPAVSEPAAPRKKTRKALLPGHAARAEPETSVAEVPPVVSEPPPPVVTSPEPPAPQVEPAPAPESAATPAPAVTQKISSHSSSAPPAPPPQPAQTPVPAPQHVVTPSPSAARQAQPAPPPPPPPPAAAESKTPTSAGSTASFQPPRRVAPAPPVVKEVPPPPPAEITLESVDTLQGVQQWLEKKMVASMDTQRTLLEQQAACLARNQHTASEITSLRQQLSSTEAEQNSLCDSEKFEEAEALESTIQEVKDMITARLEDEAGASREMANVARKLLAITGDRETLAEKIVDRIQSLQTESEEALSDMEERSERRLKAESARLDSERKRMELACTHLEKDSTNLGEEREQLTAAIEQETTIHTEERDRAVEQRGSLDLEIRELQQTLQAKMSQRQTLSEVVDSCEIRIASIRSKFEKQLSRLEAKQKRLEEAQREVQQDEKQVEQMAEELERERRVCMEGTTVRKRQISEIQCESRKLRGVRRFMARHLRMRSMWQKLMEPHLEMLNKARSEWETVTSESSKLAASLASREAEGGKLRSQLDAIRLQMPSLEAEKKVAVASRSFKEAGRIAEEIKRREENRKSFEAELENFDAELTAMREQLASCRQREEGAQAELMETEAKCGAEELRILQRQILDLEALRKKAPISQTERQLLEKEEAVFRSAQKHLAEKHGISLGDLEEIAPEELADFQDGGSEASTKDDGAASEDEVATSSGRGTSAAVAGVPRSPSQPLQPDAEEAAAEVESGPKDWDAMRQRHAELLQIEAGHEEQQSALEKGIELACEAEDFEKAEELEEERKQVDQTLLDARAERESLEVQLQAEFGLGWKDGDVDPPAAEAAEDFVEPSPAQSAAGAAEAVTGQVAAPSSEESPAEAATTEASPAEASPDGATPAEATPAEAASAEAAPPAEAAPAEAAPPMEAAPAEAAPLAETAPTGAGTDYADAGVDAAAVDGTVLAGEAAEGEPAASGFSFISATTESQEVSNFVAVEAAGAEEEVPAAAASSFSFISSGGAASDGTPSAGENVEAAPSSFSFITSSMAAGEPSEATAVADASPAAPPPPPPPPGAFDESPSRESETF